MAPFSRRPIAVLYEHPEWFAPLFAEMDRRGLCTTEIDVATLCFDPAGPAPDCGVLFNRMSPSAYLRGRGSAVPFTLEVLHWLENRGIDVINGTAAYRTEISKARQLVLFERLGLAYPASRVLHRPEQAADAAATLRYPVVVKPNVGGSGAGIRRFETPAELRAAAASGDLDLGLDGTGLVQEFAPPRGEHIVRAEVVGGRFLYAIRVYPEGDDFNLCPADLCQRGRREEAENGETHGRELRIEHEVPPPAVVAEVERLMAEAGIEVGGVEYLIDDRDGTRRYYDVNALSNFVAGAPQIIGFDPFVDLVDFLERRVDGAAESRPIRRAS